LLRRRVLADWRADAKERLVQLEASCTERTERSGEMAFSTEPNLKESRGGLRDLVVMRSVAASWLADCPHQGLEEARSELLDVRDALHLTAGRRTDRLHIQDQDGVAKALDIPDRDALLTKVAGIGRAVALAADLTWHRVHRAIDEPNRNGQVYDIGGRFARRAQRLPLADGVVEQEGEVILARAANPARDAALPLRAAAAAAQAGLTVAPATVHRLAKLCPPLPNPWPAAALNAFVSLLGAGESMITVWESLDQAGLISSMLPGWERLRSKPQWDPIHMFTVDRHLMETAVQASRLVRKVRRPDLLLLTAIFHDIGKGSGHDHSVVGAKLIRDWMPRLGMAPQDIDTMSLLIRHHLLLSDTASRRDPEDPATVAAITEVIPDLDTLQLLAALTEADSRAASPKTWSPWKAAQVARLVALSAAAISAAANGAAATVAAEPEVSARERELLAQAGTGGLKVRVDVAPVGITVTVAAPDRPGLLAAAAGTLTLHRLAIRGATARTVDGVALQVWTVQPQFGDAPQADTVRADLIRALDGGIDVAAALAKRDFGASRVPAPAPLVELLTRASSQATVLQVRAHDMPGLLFRVAETVAANGASIISALVDTHGSEAVDIFYLIGSDNAALPPAAAQQLVSAVSRALGLTADNLV
jgi:[protein-PII] uridylyltransferase